MILVVNDYNKAIEVLDKAGVKYKKYNDEFEAHVKSEIEFVLDNYLLENYKKYITVENKEKIIDKIYHKIDETEFIFQDLMEYIYYYIEKSVK